MSGPSEDFPELGPPTVEEVSEGVYAYVQPDGTWYINNTGFLVGRRGVTTIDACSTERRTREYLAAIGTVNDRPLRTLVNTHHHGDHTHGNYLFSTASVFAHERTRQEMVASGLPAPVGPWGKVDWGDLELEPPFLTYPDAVTLWADDLDCELRHVGIPAHTTNASIVWIPERSVLFCGDLLFSRGTPFVLTGSVTGSIEVLETVVRPLEAEVIVPGHGPVGGPGLIDDVLAYLRFVQDSAEKGLAAGLSQLDTARECDLGPFADLTDPERIVGNLHRACAELTGTPRGGPIDVAGHQSLRAPGGLRRPGGSGAQARRSRRAAAHGAPPRPRFTGFTAYGGMLRIARVQPDDKVFVSTAAGAVGSVATQIAKIKGCFVVGSTGSAEKARWLADDLHLDAVIDYRATPIRRALHQAAPDGIDVYFDNVGGDHLDAALACMNTLGRIAVCAMISGYNQPGACTVVRNLANVIYGRITLRGFTVADFADLRIQFVEDMTGWLRQGRVTYRDTVLDGIDAAPSALIGLFEGRNTGKMLVKLRD